MKTIYQQRNGKMVKISEPRLPYNANFIIRFYAMDWSGFRTLTECMKQFPELEAKPNASEDPFSVVEA